MLKYCFVCFFRADPRQVWSRNLLLAGDGHWQSVKNVVGEPVAVLERDWNLRVMSRQGETLDRLYDKQRAKLLFALPRGYDFHKRGTYSFRLA